MLPAYPVRWTFKPQLPLGRVWPDGQGMFYWACYRCIERNCTGKSHVGDPVGGKCESIEWGTQYLAWHTDAWHDPKNDRFPK